jgi:hypothetical protein
MQVKGEILLVQAKVAGVAGFKETSHLVGSPINGVVQGTLSFPPGFDRLCGTSRAQLTPYFVPLGGRGAWRDVKGPLKPGFVSHVAHGPS